jgi:hypothetical protein
MDLSKLSDDDLVALRNKNLNGMSDEGLRYLSSLGKSTVPAISEEKPDTGFTGAMKASAQQIQADFERLKGRTGFKDVNLAEQEAKAYEKKAGQVFKPTEESWTEAPLQKLKETAGGSLPYMVAPLAAGAAALTLPASLPTAAIATGLGGIASATQFTGSNLSRQQQEDPTLKLQDTKLGYAALASIPQAAFDMVGFRFIPGIQRIFKSAGKEISEKAAKDMIDQGIFRTAGQYIAGGAKISGIEGATEAGQQVFERLQAGLNIADKQARDEYFDSFIGGAALGAIASPFGVRGQRGQAKEVLAKAETKRGDELVAEQQAKEAAQKEQAKLQQEQQTTGNLFGEAAPTTKQVSPLPGAASTLTVREREAEAGTLKETQDLERDSLLKQANLFGTQLSDVEKQRDAAAEKGDIKAFSALDAQARALEENNKGLSEKLKTNAGIHYLKEEKRYVALTPDVELSKLRGEQKNLIKQLQGMTGPSYDAKKAASLTEKLNGIDARITELSPTPSTKERTPLTTQMDMFDEAQMGAAKRESEAKQQEDRAREQTDLIETLKGPFKKQEVLNAAAIERYQKGLVDLEKAYASGADERIVNQLIDELQKAGKEKDQAVAKAGAKTGAEQEQGIAKLERIKRSINEEAAKLAGATTDEEVNAIRTNIGALQTRYGAAQTERATANPEIVESEANQEQKDAVLTAVEGARSILSGDYLNSKNVDVASSLKSGIETDIRDAGAAYIRAAIKEINAVRAINKQQPLTNDEALKAAQAIKSRFDYIAKDPTYLAEKVRDKNLKVFTQALEKIKVANFKGPTKLQRTTPTLKQERDPLAMMRNEMAKKEPNQKRIAQIQKEIDAGKAEDVRIEAEKAKQEQVELPGVNPDQRSLFGEKPYETETTKYEPTSIVRATPANFMRFVNAQAGKFKVAKEAANRAIEQAKDRANKAKERSAKKTAETTDELKRQIAEQRNFVNDIVNADKIASQLRGQAKRLWTERGTLVKELGRVNKENKKIIRNAIAEIDATVDSRNAEIDALHARANQLLKENLGREQSLLAELEKAYAKTPEAKNNKALIVARAEIGKTEDEIKNALAKQIKEKREAEQKAIEFKETLPSTTRETVETLKKAKGKTGEIIRREKITRREVPLTAEEKRAQVIARAKEGVAERIADKKAIAERLEKGLSGTVANAKELLVSLENKLQIIEKDIKASQNKKATPAELVRRKAMAVAQKQLKDVVTELKEKGVSIERSMTVTAAQPARTERKKLLKTGVKKVNVTAQGLKAARDVEQEARDAGISREDFEFVERGLMFGFKARSEPAITGTGLTQDATQAVVDKVKLPKGLKITVLSKITPSLQAAIKNNGYDPATVKGGVLPDGSVFIVAENHADVKDVQRTIAHEVTGHLGVESLIGEAGMDALAKRVAKQEGGVLGLAEKLGVQEEALGAYMSAKQSGKSDEFAAAKALREVIAHTEEARVDKNFLGKANEFIKALVGAVRAALRKMGLDLDLNTSDVYKMLRDARKEFDAVAPGMYKGRDGEIQVRSGGAKYGPGGVVVADAADKILTQKQKQKILPANFGLLFEQRVVSATAGLMRAFENKGMKNSIEALQTKYYIANHNQRFVWASHSLTSGVPVLEPVKRADGKTEYVLKQSKGANVQGIIDALSKAKWGNAQGVNNVWSLHRILLRAESVGFDKLNFDKAEVTEKLLRANESVINSNPSLKAAIKEADAIYNQYNRDLLTRFLVSTGAMSKELANNLVKGDAYIPYYRKKEDGTIVLDLNEGVKNIRIGNIKDQPYLNELVGGNERIVDAFTGILQNTNLLMDMGLRNLATRQTAFALDSMGLLEKGKDKEGADKRTGIRKGHDIASDKAIRFYLNGDPVYAVVDTEAVGVPSELVVEGLGGVSTSVPTIVKMMGIPASILRTFITRNPVYALRQAARDPLNAVMTNGIELKAMGNSYKILGKALTGNKEAVSDVFKYGITGSNVYTGTVEDMQKQMMRMLDGKKGIDTFYAKLDTLAVNADSATRQAAFTNFRKQGMTEMEAMLATYELMPFTQRGTSASMFWLSTMVPFLNAQIQGLNVLYKAMSGKATFQEKLKVKQQFYAKGAMMFGMSVAYAVMMSDDEAYKNANDDERYNNWFVYTPFSKEPFKVPIPFELGILFKAIPEAMVNVAKGDREAGEAINAIRKLIQNNIPLGPSSLPQAIKPIIEVTADYSFYTGRSIVGERLKGVDPSERYNANTNEILKLIGKGTGSIPVLGEYLSPVQLEYLVRGYFGSLPLALASVTNPAISTGEAPEGRGIVSSTTPVIGSLFQPLDANGMINRAYKDMESIQRTKATYNKLVEDGNEKGISKLLDAEADKLNLAPLAGAFRSRMGNLAKEERRIKSDPNMSAAEKRELLDMIKEEKIGLSKELISARE